MHLRLGFLADGHSARPLVVSPQIGYSVEVGFRLKRRGGAQSTHCWLLPAMRKFLKTEQERFLGRAPHATNLCWLFPIPDEAPAEIAPQVADRQSS
jgi:hypothetical protein